MKICILHRYPLSQAISTSPYLISLLELLGNRNISVDYFSYKERTPTSSNRNLKISKTYNIPLCYDRQNKFDRSFKTLLWMFLSPFYCYLVLKDKTVDVFYCEDGVPLYSAILKFCFRDHKVITYIGDLQSAYKFGKKTILSKTIFKFVNRIEIFCWGYVDRIIAISEEMKNYILSKCNRELDIEVLKECIDTEFFQPISINNNDLKAEDEVLIMNHGLLVECKGLETLIKASKIVLDKRKKAKFVIIGQGPYYSKIKRMISSYGLEDKVILLGWIPFSEMPVYLSKCDIGVIMRRKNLGNDLVLTTALLQYWGCGKPVISPRLKTIEKEVIEGKDAILFEPDNENDLAKKIMYLIDNKSIREKMGLMGRERVKRDYNIKSRGYILANYLMGR